MTTPTITRKDPIHDFAWCRSCNFAAYIGLAGESARTRQTNTESVVHEHTSRAAAANNFPPITSCAVANNERCVFSTRETKFRPPHSSHIFLSIFLKLKTKKHIRHTNPHAKFGKDRFTGDLDEHPNFGRTFWATLFYFLFSSLSVPVAPHVVLRTMGAQKACLRPFGGVNNEK